MSAGWAAPERSGCNPITSSAAPGGPSTKEVETAPNAAAEAHAKAAVVACRMQQLPHPQQQQQLAAAAPCQSQRHEAVRVERRVLGPC
jgi:hypothetical protein